MTQHGEFGMIVNSSRPMRHRHATAGLRLDKVREVIENYDSYKNTLPPHQEEDVAFLLGPSDGLYGTSLAWYIDIPYVGKHRRPE